MPSTVILVGRFSLVCSVMQMWEKEKPALGKRLQTYMRQTEFDRFWFKYPRKVARLAAEKAYKSARRRASADAILEGVARYCQALPTESRFIPHASTWLSQGRWLDEENATMRPQPARPFTAAEIQQYEDWRRAMGGCGHRDDPCETRQQCMTRFIRHRRGEAA